MFKSSCGQALAAVVCGLSAAMTAAAEAPVPPPSVSWRMSEADGWALEWPATQPKISYLGVVSLDGPGAGAQGAMLYPAANLGGFIVAVLTHAALNEAAKSAQRAAIQNTANKVLVDYQGIIDAFEPAELMKRTDLALNATELVRRSPGRVRWTLEVLPVFWMTQDRRALIVDNVLTVRDDAGGKAARRSAVRVVGPPVPAEAVSGAWSENDGEPLKQQSALLLAQAIELSMTELEGRWDQEAAFRTIRFPEGGDERIERAQPLREYCGRAVIRTLRGELMGVPLPGSIAGATSSAACSSVAPPKAAAAQASTPTQ